MGYGFTAAQINEMRNMYTEEGVTMTAIARKFKRSRERIRQLLAKFGITRHDGGHHLTQERARQAEEHQYWHGKLDKIGCSRDVIRELTGSAIYGHSGSPVNRFLQKRAWSLRQGYEWELTFPEWLSVWQASGHWNANPAKNKNQVMTRHNRKLPFRLGNVYIASYSTMFSTLDHQRKPRTPRAPKTHCKRGHDFAKYAEWHSNGSKGKFRICGACRRQNQHDRYWKNKGR